jgi:hypothetical protein
VPSSTIQRAEEQKLRQFSVFMENKAGRLLELARLFSEQNVHIIALTILDTAESATVRFMVDDPWKARDLLQKHRMPFTEAVMVGVELPRGAEDLPQVLAALFQAEINISFTYPLLVRPYGKPVLAMHLEDDELASQVLIRCGFRVLNQLDISR